MHVPVHLLVARAEKTAWARIRSPYTCGGCGYEAVASVLGAGFGRGQSVVFVSEAARREAEQQARGNALDDCQALLKRIACPKCHWRDPKAVAALKRQVWLVRAVTIGTWAAIVAALWAGHPGDVVLIVATTLVPGMLMVFVAGFIVELKSEPAAGRIQFLTSKQAARLDAEEARASAAEDPDEGEDVVERAPRRRRTRRR